MKKLFALFQQSLFIRLLAIFIISIALFVFIMSTAITLIYQKQAQEWNSFDFFEHHINFVIDDFGVPPDLERVRSLTERLPVAVLIKDARGNWLFEDQDIDPDRIKERRPLNDNVLSLSHGRTKGLQVSRNGYEYLLFGRQSFADKHDLIISLLTTSVVLLVLFLNYLMVRHLLRPIKMLNEGAERISQGELHYRVPLKHKDELGVLTSSINNMADSLNGMLEAKRQLLLGISHELRTPITRAKIQLEMMPRSDERSSLMEDINELDMLVSDLLEAERLNSQHAGLSAEQVNIHQLTDELVAQFWSDNPLIQWHYPAPAEQLAVRLDKLRYQLLLRNLVSNALKYGDDKPIDISITKSNEKNSLILEVRDQGQGIAEEHLAHITEPFYRTDDARQRQTGGFGLGLYLCRLIAEAHGGELTVSSTLGKGTSMRVSFPQS